MYPVRMSESALLQFRKAHAGQAARRAKRFRTTGSTLRVRFAITARDVALPPVKLAIKLAIKFGRAWLTPYQGIYALEHVSRHSVGTTRFRFED